jgi:hypothetical protein
MVRDLQYPDDARQTIFSLHAGLRYDASLAVMGNACPTLPLPADGRPDFSSPFRCSGRTEDEAVRREAPGLLARLSLISMVSRIDLHAQNLLLQRRVLEELGNSGRKMQATAMSAILRNVQKDSRGGPVKLCSELVVSKPSPGLQDRMKWLSGLVSVRNCLTHRLGIVQMEDVKSPGTSIQDTKETDRLRAIWLRPILFVDGKEETIPYRNSTESEARAEIQLQEQEREWKVGDRIEITAEDCQAIAMSLQMLSNHLLADFERETNAFLAALPSTGG